VVKFPDSIDSSRDFETKKQSIIVTSEVLEFAKTSLSYMKILNNNNSIAITPDGMIYADRTTVIRNKSIDIALPGDETLFLSRELLSFLTTVSSIEGAESTALNFIREDGSYIFKWESENTLGFWAYISTPDAEIAIPDESDIEMLAPVETDPHTRIDISLEEILNVLDFFSGIYETSSSAWNPLRFNWYDENKSLEASYDHPLTNAVRPINIIEDSVVDTGVEKDLGFLIISDSLKIVSTYLYNNDITSITLLFNDLTPDLPKGAAVRLVVKNEKNDILYDVIFSKLLED
jgi:hypothetical protein